MRLFLLPISTKRTLLYCQKIQVLPTAKQTLVERTTVKATKLWTDWEKKESGWQKKVVDYGNAALRRIPYEEWGLKSVPPLSTRRREEEILGHDKNVLIFPRTVIPESKALNVLKTLGTERQALHKSRLIWCFIGMPISAPFALVPIIPNLPFFYLVFRAWSHWQTAETKEPGPPPSSGDDKTAGDEQMLLTQENGRQLVQVLDIPELEIELERAIWQVEKAISEQKEAQLDKQKKQ
ncbi:hypothetical protein SLS62_008616 [Diatrype stigma]|uniref:Mitochondrial K+-H+ exchange-related-domain-containing protein n=1 Tax=Diatrype stigma TaxID=117547 RepID=A0AAN9YN45_9PEZI